MVKKLAVLIPVYNDRAGLTKSLKCLQQQESDEFDVVVVDDGSSPPMTMEGISKDNFHLITLSRNCGIEMALNAGLQYILSKNYSFIARLDAGDISYPGRFTEQITILNTNCEIGLVGSWARFVSESDQLLFVFKAQEHDAEIRKEMKSNNAFVHSTVMFRADILRLVGNGYSMEYKAAEDFELWSRILQVAKGYNIQKVLVQKVVSPGGISAKKRKIQVLNRIRIIMKYHFDWKSLASYMGVARNCVLWLLPLRLTTWVRKVFEKKSQ